jgi:hypothetical protein
MGMVRDIEIRFFSSEGRCGVGGSSRAVCSIGKTGPIGVVEAWYPLVILVRCLTRGPRKEPEPIHVELAKTHNFRTGGDGAANTLWKIHPRRAHVLECVQVAGHYYSAASRLLWHFLCCESSLRVILRLSMYQDTKGSVM